MKRLWRTIVWMLTAASLVACVGMVGLSVLQSLGWSEQLGLRRYPAVEVGPYRASVAAWRADPRASAQVSYEADTVEVHVFRPRKVEYGPPFEQEAFHAWEGPRHGWDFHRGVAGFEAEHLAIISRPFGQASEFIGFLTRVAVPHWFAIGVTAVLPGWAGWGMYLRRRGQKRVEAGLCVGCGYDLRASPGRCPECGREGAGREGEKTRA